MKDTSSNTRPVTLFTGQWADIPVRELLPKVKAMGYDGVELACWGDHFDVDRALADEAYLKDLWQLLSDNGLTCYAISNHLVGQAICDPIDARHKAILAGDVWGDGDPEGVRQRAAAKMIDTGNACRKFMDLRPEANPFPVVVNGFTGSSIWHALYAFPPTSQDYLNKGYEDFAKRFGPILDAFEAVDVNFALEVHPTEIAFDIASSQRALDAVGQHKRFGFNYDPSHLGYQGVDYVKFIRVFSDRIYHAHMKDAWWGHGDGTVGVFGGHTDFTDPRRYWDFRSVGRGDINFEEIIVALNDIGYAGPLSVEWEDGRMDRFHGAAESAANVRRFDFPVNKVAFDAAFDKENQ
ncbi:sugar phosphate isomerase/epimerase family protein [Coraliomargarita parva]|uniref:sugar phosphate isomerase/epimerase family protein n=1 Tax=Coraliomargarita parva TaxID=3014050 RepID=UPI0022B44C0B|nr:sugar phosphate isomerase/epimerase [Coraliomargarita parva]